MVIAQHHISATYYQHKVLLRFELSYLLLPAVIAGSFYILCRITCAFSELSRTDLHGAIVAARHCDGLRRNLIF